METGEQPSGPQNYRLSDVHEFHDEAHGRPGLLGRPEILAVAGDGVRSIHSVLPVTRIRVGGGGDGSGYPHSFIVHEDCWDLTEWVLGPFVKEEFGLFVETLYNVWGLRDSRHWAATKQFLANLRPRSPTHGSAGRSPKRLPETTHLIRWATDLLHWKSWMPPWETPLPSPLTPLPPELRLMVLNLLNPWDARKAMKALGWEVHLGYWENRYPQAFAYLYELKDVDLDEVDQEYLYTEAEQLFEWDGHRSWELQNRKRIVGLLEDVNPVFLFLIVEKHKREQPPIDLPPLG
ncbi:hypothetical protein FQN54_005142 [Arachnomyces sp. PD_36]|nr:hypothetical protein FQN54_005142 [Arachnomyces sp. PD_36]